MSYWIILCRRGSEECFPPSGFGCRWDGPRCRKPFAMVRAIGGATSRYRCDLRSEIRGLPTDSESWHVRPWCHRSASAKNAGTSWPGPSRSVPPRNGLSYLDYGLRESINDDSDAMSTIIVAGKPFVEQLQDALGRGILPTPGSGIRSGRHTQSR